jgi:hypothetical protein
MKRGAHPGCNITQPIEFMQTNQPAPPPVLRLRLLTVELDGTRQTLPPTELPNAPTGAAPTPEATKP